MKFQNSWCCFLVALGSKVPLQYLRYLEEQFMPHRLLVWESFSGKKNVAFGAEKKLQSRSKYQTNLHAIKKC